MANVLLICSRNPNIPSLKIFDLEKLAHHFELDHIKSNYKTFEDPNGLAISVFSHNESVRVHGNSVALGNIETDSGKWWIPLSNAPEGAYALFRTNKNYVEILTDIVASRSIWYYFSKTMFIVSTSQRAIIACIGSFNPNNKVYPWIISSGTLGPDLSWDIYVNKMRGDSRIILNRQSWDMAVKKNPIKFEKMPMSDIEQERFLESSLQTTFNNFRLDSDKWVLALSGGYDSRYSLLMLKDRYDLKCITWGETQSLNHTSSDASIAVRLTKKFGINHEFFDTSIPNEPIDRIFDRILKAGEGRIDHLHASLDGFNRYKRMIEEGFIGLIRSDEVFGWQPVSFQADVRRQNGLFLMKDFKKLSSLNPDFTKLQELPEHFNRSSNESVASWRDRIYQEFRVPCMLAALSQSRLSYMEQANPLLAHRIVRAVRGLSDQQRTDKSLFKKIVMRITPNVPFATTQSIGQIDNLIGQKNIINYFYDTIKSQQAKSLIPKEIIKEALRALGSYRSNSNSVQNNHLRYLKKSIPGSIRQILRPGLRKIIRPPLGPVKLALRCFIIVRMHDILVEDASCLNSKSRNN